jgi:hypothetical protein
MRSALAAFATGLRHPLTILGEVARIVLGTAAATAVLAALSAGCGGPFAVIRKVAGAVLPAETTGARRLFAVFREVPWVSGMPLFGHGSPSLFVIPHIERTALRPGCFTIAVRA